MAFDRTKEYVALIAEKMNEIQQLCYANHIPFFACFGVKQEEGKKKIDKVVVSNVAEEKENDMKHKSFCLMPTLFDEIGGEDKPFGKFLAVINCAETAFVTKPIDFSDIDTGDIGFNMPTQMPDTLD